MPRLLRRFASGFNGKQLSLWKLIHSPIDGQARPATDSELLNHARSEKSGTAKLVHLVAVRDATLVDFMEFYQVHLMNPRVLVGMFGGVLMV